MSWSYLHFAKINLVASWRMDWKEPKWIQRGSKCWPLIIQVEEAESANTENTYSVVRWKLQEVKGKTIIRFYKNYKDYHLSRSFLSACVTWWEANLWVRKQGKISDSSQLLTVSLLRRKEIKFRVCVGICIRLGMEEWLF